MAGQKQIIDSSTTDIFVLSASTLNELMYTIPSAFISSSAFIIYERIDFYDLLIRFSLNVIL